MAFLTSKIQRWFLILVLLLAPGGMTHVESAGAADEYSIKSAFLFNFCRFISWPESSFSSPTAPITIGIIGDDPFRGILEQTVQNEKMGRRSIRVEHYSSAAEARNCQLLFVSSSEMGRIDSVLGAVRGRSVVTVGESDSFLSRGGMIALTAEQKRVRLVIHSGRLQAANLGVSSKLLRVAEVQR